MWQYFPGLRCQKLDWLSFFLLAYVKKGPEITQTEKKRMKSKVKYTQKYRLHLTLPEDSEVVRRMHNSHLGGVITQLGSEKDG